MIFFVNNIFCFLYLLLYAIRLILLIKIAFFEGLNNTTDNVKIIHSLYLEDIDNGETKNVYRKRFGSHCQERK